MVGYYIIVTLLVLLIGNTTLFGGDTVHFFLLTFLLLIINSLEIYKRYISAKSHFFINPVVIGTIVTFLIAGGGLTNWFQIKNGEYQLYEVSNQVLIHEKMWLKKAMMLTCLASICTWVGYKLNFGSNLFSFWINNEYFRRILKVRIRKNVLLALVIIAYLSKFYLFKIGLYGRITSVEYFEPGVGYKLGSQLRILADLSYLTFIIICINYFRVKSRFFGVLFFLSVCLEFFFAFIYGARSPVLYLFLILFVCHYYVNGVIDKRLALLVPVALIFAFTTVLEYKNFVLSRYFVRKSNPVELIVDFIKFREIHNKQINKKFEEKIQDNLLASLNSVPNAAMAIRHKDKYGLSKEDPPFLKGILLSPFDAFVPKFIQGKNDAAWGFWFKENVLKLNVGLKYSISITPVGFLYFAGDYIMLIVGFLIYGILLKFNYIVLINAKTDLSFIAYFMFLSVLYNYQSEINATYVYFIRYFFIYPFILLILFGKFAK